MPTKANICSFSNIQTHFVYDGNELVCESDGSGSLTAVNDSGADGVWARHNLTTDWFYTFDPQGCLSQKVGRDGSVLCSSIYDAQGHEATTDTHPDPFSGYGGQWGYYADWETSTTGGGSCLYLLGHRFYDPDAGRFLTRAPSGMTEASTCMPIRRIIPLMILTLWGCGMLEWCLGAQLAVASMEPGVESPAMLVLSLMVLVLSVSYGMVQDTVLGQV